MEHNSWQNRFQTIRSNKVFELTVISIIIFSALVIGAKTYDIPDDVSRLVTILDWGITLFFLIEISIRFLAEEHKKNFFKSGWNIFDTLIVVVSIIPIENTDMALVGRLVRIFRVLRMVSIIPELRLLLNSLLKALPQLGYVLLLMFIIFYIYAAIGSTFFYDINKELWRDIAVSMLTLFRVMTFEDWTDVMYETMEVYPLSWAYFLSFIFFTAFAFLNMIIGIVVNVLEDERQKDRKKAQEERGEPTLLELQQQLDEIKQLLHKQKQ
ncbi:ion transporter [Endozoicomonas montiporae]|uniref:Ion transporter n=2 Tax=Endozoicomonas montiporae TaxID=1027273 RepID=A0A081NAF7_9GAMM|nr:ion transporter [Endozoicomonas montiporae]AMO56892.1 Kef-type K+ transporter, NAD-binding component [Endozoicomonas montiporae CL-33]KEQ15430.1 ion transporter [Endozoicomonas montiporae]